MAEGRSSAMVSALTRALKGVQTRPEDAAAVALARRYARMIDEDSANLWRLGPRLLETLVELRMTPKARAAVVRGGSSGGSAQRTALDELRERRAARAHGAQAVDPSAT